MTRLLLTLATVLGVATAAIAQSPTDPFPAPVGSGHAPIVVEFIDFAVVPGIEDGRPPRMTILVAEPGTRRLFVNDMNGPIHSISYDGKTVTRYLDTNDPTWGYPIQSRGNERGMQSMAFHPQFGQRGAPGYGRFYTWVDIVDTKPEPDFRPGDQSRNSHDTVLLEWTARDASAATYDGGAPRELLRLEQPYSNHNGGQIGFNPTAAPGDPDLGLLYVGIADGGSGGDPMNMAQDLSSAFGKVFRIDPLRSNSANSKYGIPADNPFAEADDPKTLGEIYAYGTRNPQRFAWDSETGDFYMADIGQNTIEELTLVPKGANLGWNVWEGSYRYLGREGVGLDAPRGDPKVTFPVAEYAQNDPLLQRQSAATGVHVYRANAIAAIAGMVLWGDNPSGEVWATPLDPRPDGGQAGIRRVLLNDGGTPKTLLELIREKAPDAGRADLRFGSGPDGEVFLLNKQDGTIRKLGQRSSGSR
jgi:glucose/arabinose dehydrogenase